MNPYIAWKAELEMACFVGIWINQNTDSEWQQPMISTNFSNYKKKWQMLSCKTYMSNILVLLNYWPEADHQVSFE